MNQAIADDDITAVRANGERITINVRLGKPYKKDAESWACPLSVDPIYPRIPDIVGGTSFQSLCLAARLALYFLNGFKEDGGQLLCDDGTDFPLDAYALIDPKAHRGPSEA
jgi:hypothetical protein